MKLHQLPKCSYPVVAVLLLLFAAGAWAQVESGAAAPAPTKIGVVNVRQVIVSTAEGKQASARLQVQFLPQQADLDNLQRQIQDLQNRLNTGARTLSDDEKARLQRQGELLARQFQRRQEDVSEQINATQADVVDEIGRKMLAVLDRYSRENGLAVVLDSSAQASAVIYNAGQTDITEDIIRLYDQEHPVQAAPPPPSSQPASPGPASTPAQ